MHTREKGAKGETVACLFLEKNGFTIKARNYQKKWGEIDIIAKKDGKLHFVEVKSVTFAGPSSSDSYRPEDNVHPNKLRHIGRMIETYIAEQGSVAETAFHFHVLCVFMNLSTRVARIKWIKDVIV